MKAARDLPFEQALRHEGRTFIELVSRTETLERIRATQARYEDGADTPTAFGIVDPRP